MHNLFNNPSFKRLLMSLLWLVGFILIGGGWQLWEQDNSMQYTVRLEIDEKQNYVKKYQALIKAGAKEIKRTNRYVLLTVDNKLRHDLPPSVRVLRADYAPIAKINYLEKSEDYQFQFLQELKEQSQIYEVKTPEVSTKLYQFVLGTFSLRTGAEQQKKTLTNIIDNLEIRSTTLRGKRYWRVLSPEYQRSVYDEIRRQLNRNDIDFITKTRID